MSHQAAICQVSYGFLRRSLVTLGFSTLDFSTMPFVVRFTVSCGFSTTGFLGRFTVPCGSFFSSRSGSAKIPPSICSDADRSTSPPGCPELSAPLAADASLCCLFLLKFLPTPLLPIALAAGPLLRDWWMLACIHQPRPQFCCHRLRITFGGSVIHQPRIVPHSGAPARGDTKLPQLQRGAAIAQANPDRSADAVTFPMVSMGWT